MKHVLLGLYTGALNVWKYATYEFDQATLDNFCHAAAGPGFSCGHLENDTQGVCFKEGIEEVRCDQAVVSSISRNFARLAASLPSLYSTEDRLMPKFWWLKSPPTYKEFLAKPEISRELKRHEVLYLAANLTNPELIPFVELCLAMPGVGVTGDPWVEQGRIGYIEARPEIRQTEGVADMFKDEHAKEMTEFGELLDKLDMWHATNVMYRLTDEEVEAFGKTIVDTFEFMFNHANLVNTGDMQFVRWFLKLVLLHGDSLRPASLQKSDDINVWLSPLRIKNDGRLFFTLGFEEVLSPEGLDRLNHGLLEESRIEQIVTHDLFDYFKHEEVVKYLAKRELTVADPCFLALSFAFMASQSALIEGTTDLRRILLSGRCSANKYSLFIPDVHDFRETIMWTLRLITLAQTPEHFDLDNIWTLVRLAKEFAIQELEIDFLKAITGKYTNVRIKPMFDFEPKVVFRSLISDDSKGVPGMKDCVS